MDELVNGTIYFNDGSKIKFQFKRDLMRDKISVATSMEKIISSKTWSIFLDNRLLFIPMSSVKMVELSPESQTADDLPKSILRAKSVK